jgi:hypothetical protein
MNIISFCFNIIQKYFTLIISISVFIFIPIFSSGSSNSSGKIRTVKVNNVVDFYKAIGSNTTIILSPGDYHLNQIDSNTKNPNCNWATVLFDEIMLDEKIDEDMTLLISGIKNFTIKSDCKKGDSVRILTNRRVACVLAFRNCISVHIEGVIFGHDILKYTDPADPWVSFCAGEVLKFYDCTGISIRKSIFFGCGTRGFLAHRCNNFKLDKCLIRDCSYGAFGTFSCMNVIIKNSVFKHNTYRVFIEIENSDGVKMINTKLQNNTQAEYMETPYKITNSKNFELKNLKCKDNDFNIDCFLYHNEN